MIRPTPRAVLLFGAGIPCALLAVVVDDGLWPVGLVFLAVALLLFGADAMLAPAARSLALAVHTPATLYVGDGDALTVDVGLGPGRHAIGFTARCDVGELLVTPPERTFSVAPGTTVRTEFPLWPRRRGQVLCDRLWLRWRGPLGLAVRQRVETLAQTITIVPNIHAVRAGAARFYARDALFGAKSQRQHGDGSEFDALRAYVPGLDHRAIDWKRSAKHRSLVCKEFRAERNHPIILALDTGYLMGEPLGDIPKLDHAINAGLLLAFMSLKSGDQVGLFAFDSDVRQYTAPAGGTQQFQRLQRLTAEIEYRHDETNFTLGLTSLLGRLKRRSLIVLVTDFVDTVTAELMIENVARLAARHLVLFVTLQDPHLAAAVDETPRTLEGIARSVVADGFLRDRAVVLERLRRLGVHFVDVPAERLSLEVLNRYLMIVQRELI